MAKQKYYKYWMGYYIYTEREKQCIVHTHNDCKYSDYDKL